MVSFFTGGEGEIRTLEPCYRLHDFQSCALDQLGDFSIFIHFLDVFHIKPMYYITPVFKNQVFFSIFLKFFIRRLFCAVDLIKMLVKRLEM